MRNGFAELIRYPGVRVAKTEEVMRNIIELDFDGALKATPAHPPHPSLFLRLPQLPPLDPPPPPPAKTAQK